MMCYSKEQNEQNFDNQLESRFEFNRLLKFSCVLEVQLQQGHAFVILYPFGSPDSSNKGICGWNEELSNILTTRSSACCLTFEASARSFCHCTAYTCLTGAWYDLTRSNRKLEMERSKLGCLSCPYLSKIMRHPVCVRSFPWRPAKSMLSFCWENVKINPTTTDIWIHNL